MKCSPENSSSAKGIVGYVLAMQQIPPDIVCVGIIVGTPRWLHKPWQPVHFDRQSAFHTERFAAGMCIAPEAGDSPKMRFHIHDAPVTLLGYGKHRFTPANFS